MSKELFEEFNKQANYNLGVRGNLSKVVVSYSNLAKSMGKEEIATEMISNLPASESLNNPDYRLDEIVAMYEAPVVEHTRTR